MKAEILLDKSKCVSYGQCIISCTPGANVLKPGRVKIVRNKCMGFGDCVSVCPNEARRLVGEYMTVDEVMEEIVRARIFYENSGGGVTLSGGEPLMQ